jgi:hypothetical protein
MELFSYHDSETGVWSGVFSVPNSVEAARQFREILQDPKQYMSKYREHITLYKVGDFDVETGHIYLNMKTEEEVVDGKEVENDVQVNIPILAGKAVMVKLKKEDKS